MKKLSLGLWAILVMMFALFAFCASFGGIRGTVFPKDGADKVMAISGKDTIVTNVVAGTFYFSNIKKTTYKVWVHAKPPFKDTPIENVPVVDSAVTDIGVVKMLQ